LLEKINDDYDDDMKENHGKKLVLMEFMYNI